MKRTLRYLSVCFTLATTGSVMAQSAPTPPPDNSTGPGANIDAKRIPVETAKPEYTTNDAGEVVRLNPFEVTSARDTGYQAAETLAGTRIRTNLADVAASISVIDKQFLDDVGATDNATLLSYVTNTDVASTRGTYAGVGNGQSYSEQSNLLNPNTANRVRGLTSADNARDYYITDIPWDSFNTGRIDLLRGPNSILYGLGSPAGIINQSTNNAEFYNKGQIQVRTGSYGSDRASVDVNQDLIHDVLALRIDGMWDDTKYQQEPAFQNQKRLYGTLRYDPRIFKRPDFHTSISGKFEHGEINADRPRLVPPGDSFTAWWRPTTVSASNPFGGMGQAVVNNPYDPWRTDNVVAGNGYGTVVAGTPNYQPYLADAISNVQQPGWLIDGQTGSLYQIYGGIINAGGIDNNGNPLSASSALVGRYNNGMLYSVGGMINAANNYKLPGYQFGQYKTMSIQDPSIFNFYHTLIDGPTKWEMQDWNAANVDVSQTMWDNRVGIDLTYDRQRYKQGGEALLGYQPSLSIDIQRNFADYYTYSGNNGENATSNANFGRPFVAGGPGSGSSYSSDREVNRASLYAELRASDLTDSSFWVKLIGKHRFNGVVSNEKYWNESQSWQMYANSQAWDGFWNGNAGNTNAINNRPPTAVIYLGSPVLGLNSPANAHVPGIGAPVTLQSGGVYMFNPAYKNYSVSPTAAWTVPSNLLQVYNPAASPAPTQSSNPANLVGWSYYQDNLITDNGPNGALATGATKSLRETTSYSGNYQGYLWNNALVLTLGWRYDSVGTKDVAANKVTLNRNELDLSPGDYSLPGLFPPTQIFGGHSTSGGLVLHLNDLLARDPLPIGVGLTYNDSSNFQVTSVRRDVYGNVIGNPTGKTKEYGVVLSTKDNRFFLRITHYDTQIANGGAFLSLASGSPGGVIANGLNWRNVFLYQLGGYTMDTANQASYRNTWTNAYPTETAAQAQTEEDAAIAGWNNIQKHLEKTGFFNYWNFVPTGPDSVLVDRTTYLNNPSMYQPTTSTVSSYSPAPGGPPGYTVTADQESKGYEFDATANLLPNWRVSFNAAEAVSIQSNVGGAAMNDFMAYIQSQLYNADGSLTPAGMLPRFGGASNAIGPSVWGPFKASWTLLKLQEGADVSELRKWSYKAVTNYTFDRGWIKGLGLGGGYRWQDRDVIGYPVDPNTGNFILSKPFYGPSEGYVDLWASYRFKIWRGIKDTLQLNVYNVGAKNGLIPVSIEPDGVTWAAARVKPVQEWQLTNTIDF